MPLPMHLFMRSISPSAAGLAFACLLAIFGLPLQQAYGADTNAPTIVVQPTSDFAGVGEDHIFRVQATGTGPLRYQWYLNYSPMASQTNSFLWLTNLSVNYAAYFYVTVANAAGTATSSNVYFAVQDPLIARRLETGRLLQVGTQVGVPIILRANGRENSASFSMTYDTNKYANPVFLPAYTNATAKTDLSVAGAIGVSVALPAGEAFPSGYPWLGLLQFDLVTNAGIFQGGLAFATNPLPITATNVNGLSLQINAATQPQYQLLTAQPTLQPQSGLFEHKMLVSNPSSILLSNLDILAFDLGFDSGGKSNVFQNGQTWLTNYPYGDPLLDVATNCTIGLYVGNITTSTFSDYLRLGNVNPGVDDGTTNHLLAYAQIYNLLPGESRLLTLEYLVPDHVTVPNPVYTLYQEGQIPFALIPPYNVATVSIVTNRYVNQTFLVEFQTLLNRQYYIQYSDTLMGLETNALTVFPPVLGNGNRMQWIDNGPPKTDSAPVNSARFYRVVKH